MKKQTFLELIKRMRNQGYTLGSEVKYTLDKVQTEWIRKHAKSKGLKVKLKYMNPFDFLCKVPHFLTTLVPLCVDLKDKYFDKGSLKSIEYALKHKIPLPPLILNYSNMWYGYPSHEGRHRAYVCYKLGVKKVPVLVIRKR